MIWVSPGGAPVVSHQQEAVGKGDCAEAVIEGGQVTWDALLNQVKEVCVLGSEGLMSG